MYHRNLLVKDITVGSGTVYVDLQTEWSRAGLSGDLESSDIDMSGKVFKTVMFSIINEPADADLSIDIDKSATFRIKYGETVLVHDIESSTPIEVSDSTYGGAEGKLRITAKSDCGEINVRKF